MKCVKWPIVVLGWLAACHADTLSTTQSVALSIMAIGKVSVGPAVQLVPAGPNFAPYTGVLPVNFRVRTSPGGGGLITIQANSDFAPAGGPSISSGALQFTCTGASLGTPCSGTQVVRTSSQTPVLAIPGSACTGGGGACSTVDPNSVSVVFGLDNSPQYPTGTYSAQVTFTISST